MHCFEHIYYSQLNIQNKCAYQFEDEMMCDNKNLTKINILFRFSYLERPWCLWDFSMALRLILYLEEYLRSNYTLVSFAW